MMLRLLVTVSICFSALLMPQVQLLAQTDGQTGRIVTIPMQDGSVDSGQLFQAVSGELHWVAGSITAFSRAFGVESQGAQRLPKDRVDALLTNFPDVFSVQPDPNSGEANLAINVDGLAKMLADKKSGLRKWFANAQSISLASIAKVESTWAADATAPLRIMVVMAGLHGVESTSEAVAVELSSRTNLPACVFSYPNDAPIAESAGLLVVELQDLHRQYPNSKVTLITHSMGGLVSRCAIELEGAGATERSSVAARTGVDQLIQVCPPNHGSGLAQYGPLLEGAEQLYRLVNRNGERKSRALFRTIVDGFNEASADLDPKSRILSQLNAAKRNPAVGYTILAGTEGPLRGAMTGLLGNIWDRVASSVNEPKELDNRIRDVLACDELQNGKGDGVVTLESAKLDGVEDFQVMAMHHLVWNELDSDAGRKMLEAVANRLGISL